MSDGKDQVDSVDLAKSFGLRHHNVLSSIDLVLRQCPGATSHYQFVQRPVTAGLGGTRYTRHAMIDREGFMLLAMAFPSKQRELALQWLRGFSDAA